MAKSISAVLLAFIPVLLIFAQASNTGDIRLNQYGHIAANYETIWQSPEPIAGDVFLPGDSFVKTESGTIAFTFAEGSLPTVLRLYDGDRNLRFSKKFDRTINIQFSDNEHYVAFFDGEHLTVMNLISGHLSRYPASITFALDDEGHPAYYDGKTGRIKYKNISIGVDIVPSAILFYNDLPVVFSAKGIFILRGNQLHKAFNFKGKFFEAKVIDDGLYFVEKENRGRRFHYTLYTTSDCKNFSVADESIYYQPDNTETHEPIRAPLHYYETSFPSLVRNAYAQIQEWGDVYLHPGVDLFEEPYEEVYSVKDGVVRAILTTGDERYWRTAIENSDYPGEGYLYAHLNQNSLVFAVGDTVEAGDVIGTLFPAWGWAPHCHFARIEPVGQEWNGDWWTVDNPLVDITNMTDSISPVFEWALGSDMFAFRTRDGVYLDPLDLSGEIQIIAKCCDYAYSIAFESRITPWDLRFQLYSTLNPDSVIYEKYSFALDMPLDTYFSNQYETLVLNTIYSRDATCFSTNSSSARDFFFIISNSNGDSVISAEDSLEVLNTHDFSNGSYILEVIARDASENATAAYMVVTINNTSPAAPHPRNPSPLARFALGRNFPNPFNSTTTIPYALPTAAPVSLDIYDLRGDKIVSLQNGWTEAGLHRLTFDGADLVSGVYIYRLSAGESRAANQMVLIK